MDPDQTLSAIEAEITAIELRLKDLDSLQKRLGTLKSVRDSLRERIIDWRDSDNALKSVLNRSQELLGQNTQTPPIKQKGAKKPNRQGQTQSKDTSKRPKQPSKAIRWNVNQMAYGIMRRALSNTSVPTELETVLEANYGPQWQNTMVHGPISGVMGSLPIEADLPSDKSILRGWLSGVAKKLLLIRTNQIPDGVTYNGNIAQLANLAENHSPENLRKAFTAWGLELEK